MDNNRNYRSVNGFTIIIFMVIVFGALWMANRMQMNRQEMTYTEFVKQVEAENVTEVYIDQNMRMFEYDTQLALENREFTSNILTVQFPDSAIVSLRHTQNTPEHMTVKVLTPGGKVSYIVPVLKVKRYTIHELFEKKLFFLIPFYIFVYEKDFKELEENKKKLKQLEEEYAAIRERLEIACQMGDLTEYPKVVILAMSRKVIEHLAAKYEKVVKGVSQQMGGKVLNYEAKDILNRGRAEGRREGEEQTKIQIAKKLLALGNDTFTKKIFL